MDDKSPSPASTVAPSSSGYNAIEVLSLRDRIVNAIDESEIELTPLQVAQRIHANHSSVRVYLPQLVKEGRIVTPYHGAYCNKITHGMIFSPIKVHNLVVTASAVVDKSEEIIERVGTVKVRVVFGFQRDKISMFISCDAGMDRNACLLAIQRCFDIARVRLGKDLEQVTIKTFEANRDYLGVRLDRAQCLTRQGLLDTIERIYQKEDVVRHEFKVTKDMTLTEFEALLKGGVTAYNVTQSSFALIQEVRKLAEALKGTNDQLLHQGKVLDAILGWIYKNNDNGGKNDDAVKGENSVS